MLDAEPSLPADLLDRDPYQMYDALFRITGQRHDPCLLDTFIAAVRYMAGEPKKPWWNTPWVTAGGGPKAGSTGKDVKDVNLFTGDWKPYGQSPAAESAAGAKSAREGGAPHHAGNYAIENLIGIAKPFIVRVLVKGDEKIGGSLIDVEIAGQRTMISYRPDLAIKKMVFRTESAELDHVQLGRLPAAPT